MYSVVITHIFNTTYGKIIITQYKQRCTYHLIFIDVIVQSSTSPQLVLTTEKTVLIVGGKHLICEFPANTCRGQVLHTWMSTFYACLYFYPRNEKDFITIAGCISLLQLHVPGFKVEKRRQNKTPQTFREKSSGLHDGLSRSDQELNRYVGTYMYMVFIMVCKMQNNFPMLMTTLLI